jgi:hypothetical protein
MGNGCSRRQKNSGGNPLNEVAQLKTALPQLEPKIKDNPDTGFINARMIEVGEPPDIIHAEDLKDILHCDT